MYMAGDKPGAGSYICVNCQKTVILENSDDMLPFCKNCESIWFTRSINI